MSRKTKKQGYGKRILAGILSAVVVLSSVQIPVKVHAEAWDQDKFADNLKLRFWKDEQPGVRFYINAAAKYILENQVQSIRRSAVPLENGPCGICSEECTPVRIISTVFRKIILKTIWDG